MQKNWRKTLYYIGLYQYKGAWKCSSLVFIKKKKDNWNVVWTYSSGYLYSHWNNCQLIRDGDVVLNEKIFDYSVAKKIAA